MPQLAPAPDTTDQQHAYMPAAGLVRIRGRGTCMSEWQRDSDIPALHLFSDTELVLSIILHFTFSLFLIR